LQKTTKNKRKKKVFFIFGILFQKKQRTFIIDCITLTLWGYYYVFWGRTWRL